MATDGVRRGAKPHLGSWPEQQSSIEPAQVPHAALDVTPSGIGAKVVREADPTVRRAGGGTQKRSALEVAQGASVLKASAFEYAIPKARLLCDHNAPKGIGGGFPASNEFDFFLGEIDHRPADVFVGLGNNSVWDLACRRGAKWMVVGDIDRGVLSAQEHLFRPLLAIASGRADFLSMLAGVPIDPALDDAPLEIVFSAIERTRARLGIEAPERAAFIRDVEARLEREVGRAQAAYVSGHLKWIANPKRSFEDANADSPLSSYRYGGKDDPYLYFRDRYDPSRLKEKGAPREWLQDRFASVFSSEEAFAWLKDMFASDRVRYFRGDITDPRAYEAIGEWVRSIGAEVSGYATSNIWDFAYQDPRRVTALAARTIDSVMNALPTDESFTVYRTRACEPPHRYEQYRLASKAQILEELGRTNNPIEGLDLRPDIEIALDAMSKQTPRLAESGRSGLRMYFGSALHAYSHGAYWSHSKNLAELLDSASTFHFSDGGGGGDALLIPIAEDRRRLIVRFLELVASAAVHSEGAAEFIRDTGIPAGATGDQIAGLIARAAEIRGLRYPDEH